MKYLIPSTLEGSYNASALRSEQFTTSGLICAWHHRHNRTMVALVRSKILYEGAGSVRRAADRWQTLERLESMSGNAVTATLLHCGAEVSEINAILEIFLDEVEWEGSAAQNLGGRLGYLLDEAKINLAKTGSF